MKKLFDKLSILGCLLPFVIGGLFPIVMMFIKLWDACNGHIGYFLLNLAMIPFIILGGINFFRGVFAIMERDGEKFYHAKPWRVSVYLLVTIAGYFAFFCAIALWIKNHVVP